MMIASLPRQSALFETQVLKTTEGLSLELYVFSVLRPSRAEIIFLEEILKFGMYKLEVMDKEKSSRERI